MIEITLNGERRTLSRPLSVCELIDHVGRDPRKVAVEINCEIVPNMHHAERHLRAGDAVEVVTLVGGGEHPPADKPLKIGNFTFHSRLITGTGKYSTYGLMRDCLAASGCEVTTVAVRRERLINKEGHSILDFLDLKKLTILPNTAGCFSAEDAVRHARMLASYSPTWAIPRPTGSSSNAWVTRGRCSPIPSRLCERCRCRCCRPSRERFFLRA
jgi:thiazole synthase